MERERKTTKRAKENSTDKKNVAKQQKKRDRKKGKKKRAKEEWDEHWRSFQDQLRPFGLTIFECRADGNCLFRSFADQMERNQHLHAQYRENCITYMRENEDEFKPFILEDYEEYLDEMSKLTEWGGNIEIIALSRKLQVNVIIHTLNEPRLEILYPTPEWCEGTIHLAYHDQSHYDSIRPIHDDHASGDGPGNILQPDIHNEPIPECLREGNENETIEQPTKKDKKKSKNEKKKEKKSFKKMTKRERRLAKKMEKSQKRKQKCHKKKKEATPPPVNPSDKGAIRI